MVHYISANQVMKNYGISRSTLYRWQEDPQVLFPAPVKIGHRILWRDYDLEQFDQRLREFGGAKDAQ